MTLVIDQNTLEKIQKQNKENLKAAKDGTIVKYAYVKPYLFIGTSVHWSTTHNITFINELKVELKKLNEGIDEGTVTVTKATMKSGDKGTLTFAKTSGKNTLGSTAKGQLKGVTDKAIVVT